MGNHIGSYSELGLALFGKNGKTIIDIFITISQIGFCIAYLLFIGNQVDKVVCYESNFATCDKKSLYIGVTAILLIPICWMKTLKGISYISFAANLSIIFGRKTYPKLSNLLCSNCDICVQRKNNE